MSRRRRASARARERNEREVAELRARFRACGPFVRAQIEREVGRRLLARIPFGPADERRTHADRVLLDVLAHLARTGVLRARSINNPPPVAYRDGE